MNLKPILILGPTASGKTALALKMAEQWPVEIISIDSALVYRDMDIGTAKPSPEERARVPHHLIDILDPAQSYSTAQFHRDCLRLVGEIQERKKRPLIVGGTMLYARSLLNGLDALPEADPIIRQRLDTEAAEFGWPAMHEKLAAIDPESAARLPPNDSQRIQRALEVYELTGSPISAQWGKSALPPLDVTVVSLEFRDRSILHQRIAKRFDQMLEAGFLAEVGRLRQRSDLNPGLPSIRCVGYRQAWEHLDGSIDFATFREKSIVSTRQLAKRQMTWLRSLPVELRLDATQPALQFQQIASLPPLATRDFDQ